MNFQPFVMCRFSAHKAFHIFFSSLKELCIYEIEIFCNIINVFTVTFNQLNVSLLNKLNSLKAKAKAKQTNKQTE